MRYICLNKYGYYCSTLFTLPPLPTPPPYTHTHSVSVTFINYAGERRTLPGLVGESLLNVAVRHNYKFVDGACGGGGSPAAALHKEGEWLEPKYGEGAQCYFCHVVIPTSHYSALPPKREDEIKYLSQYPFPEDVASTSRLACQVTLTKDMNDMLVYVPDGPPSDIP